MNIEYKDLLKTLQANKNIECIFVDYFDTLVHRKVNPEYIKYIHSKYISALLSTSSYSSEEVYAMRAFVERNLYQYSLAKKQDTEFLYADMASELYNTIKEWNSSQSQLGITQEEFVEISKQLELNIEFTNQYKNTELINILYEQKALGKKIVLISDFYFDADMFKSMIRFHGIEDLFEGIYISAVERKSKRAGDIYAQVLKMENIENPSNCIMIGDNMGSDIHNATEHKINTCYINQHQIHNKYQELVKTQLTLESNRSIVKKKISNLKSSQNIPFFGFGLSLYSFIENLYKELLLRDAKQVFFLAREGKFLKELFDLYQTQVTGSKIIQTKYLYVSRRSTFLASLKPIAEETFNTLFRQYKDISVLEFFTNLSFSESESRTLFEEIFGTKQNTIIDKRLVEFENTSEFKQIIAHTKFQDLYEEKRQTQKNRFLKYLSQKGFSFDKNLYIVDAGWKGTIQDHIFRILGEKTKVIGYYFGIQNPSNLEKLNIKKGLVFSNFGIDTKYYSIYAENRSLVEMVLGTDHGSTKEYIVSELGVVEPLLEENEEEKNLFINIVSNIQNQFLDLFKELNTMFMSEHRSTNYFADIFTKHYAKMMFLPSKQELSLYGKMYHFENFGIFEKANTTQKIGYRSSIKKLLQYLKSPKLIKQEVWSTFSFYTLKIPYLYRFYGIVRYLYFKIYKR